MHRTTEQDPTLGAPLSDWCIDLKGRGPSQGASLYVPDGLNNREGPQAREPSKCPNWQIYGERLAKEAFWWPATRGLKKDSDRAVTPVVEAVRVPAHLALPGSLQAKQLHHLHAQHSLGQSCHRQKKSYIYACRVTSVMSDSLQPCGLPGFFVREGLLQARILERIGQDWLPYPSRALYFQLS